MTRTRIRWTLALTLGAWLLVAPPAHAYVEWLSGTAAWQALIAGLMAAGLSIKVFWRRLRARFSRSSSTPSEETESEVT